MNATEDGQPLGEGLVSIVAALTQPSVVQQIRDLHASSRDFHYVTYEWRTICRHCRMQYPCPTVRLIEEAGA